MPGPATAPDRAPDHAPGTDGLRPLRVAAAVEAATLVALLVNLLTVHVEALASALGPLHGTAYLAGIAVTMLHPFPRSARLLAWVPGIGAWLASRRSSS